MESREFELLLKNCQADCYRHALRLTKDEDEAKDLLQDTMTRAFIYKDKFQEGTNFNAWIYTIMKNLFLNLKSKQKRVPVSLDIQNPEIGYFVEDKSVANSGLRQLIESDLEAEIDTIDGKFGQTFNMYFRGFQYQEIAERMKIPLGTVKNRIHVARKLLQNRVSRELC